MPGGFWVKMKAFCNIHKNKLFYLCMLLFVFIPIFVAIFVANSIHKVSVKQKIDYFLQKENVFDILKTGDIICRNGNGIWSDLSRELSIRDKRYSHAGIVIVLGERNIHVIHSEANDYTGIGKVEEISLTDYLLGGDEAGVYRLQCNNPCIEDSLTFIQIARTYLNKPFDYSFDLEDSSKMYCSEYVYNVFLDLKPSVMLLKAKKNDKVYVPVDSCNDPSIFTEVMVFPNFHK